MHETSTKAVNEIFKESRRLLKKGGIMMHLDNTRLREFPPLESFLAAWEVYNNNESFGGTYREMDLTREATKSGFAEKNSRMAMVDIYKPSKVINYGTNVIKFPACVAVK